MVSVDTYKAAVARAAVGAGAEIVNDVSALQWDSQMASTCAELGCGVVLMHTRGKPAQWRSLPADPNLISLVEHELASRLQVAMERGVQPSRIVIDPGFGFGKNFEENYPLLAHLGELRAARISVVGRDLAQILHWSHPRQAIGARCAAPRAAVRISCGDGSQYSAAALTSSASTT